MREAAAAFESRLIDVRDPFTQSQVGQPAAVVEGVALNGGRGVAEGDVCEATAVVERALADRRNRGACETKKTHLATMQSQTKNAIERHTPFLLPHAQVGLSGT